MIDLLKLLLHWLDGLRVVDFVLICALPVFLLLVMVQLFILVALELL